MPTCANLEECARAIVRRAKLPAVIALLLEPLVYWGPVGPSHGIPLAYACSGGSPALGPVIYGLDALGLSGTTLDVSSDGTVVLEVNAAQFTEESLLAALRVTVTDTGGKEAPGELRVLRKVDDRRYDLGWRADAPLLGGPYTLDLEGPLPGGVTTRSFELHVVGPPTKLAPPGLEPADWVSVTRGTGDDVSCDVQYACSTTTITFPGTERTYTGLDLALTTPDISGVTPWSVDLVPVDGKGRFLEQPPAALVWRSDASTLTGLVFEDELDEYCVVERVRDLWSGAEIRTNPLCFRPSAAARDESTYELGRCKEPPTPALTRRWCELTGSSVSFCATPAEPPDAGESPGADDGGAGGNAAADPGFAADTDAPEQSASGCSLTPGVGRRTSRAWIPALAAMFLFRRRTPRAR